MTSTIRRWVETDTGHRVPNHRSKCRNFHGHRYRWEAELKGEVVTRDGASEEGMLIDFGDVSKILEEQIHDIVDHAFIIYVGDNEGIEALTVLGAGHKTLVVPFVLTAENLAKWAFAQIEPFIETAYGNELRLAAFHVRETPKSWASWAP